MSECQYCEFQAIDKPIDSDGLKEIEEVSSRAEDTPTSLVQRVQLWRFSRRRKTIHETLIRHAYLVSARKL